MLQTQCSISDVIKEAMEDNTSEVIVRFSEWVTGRRINIPDGRNEEVRRGELDG